MRLAWIRRVTAALLYVASGGAARAGGLLLYEVDAADVGLASAGYGARAQDASTVLTNPAGMTRLQGSQVLLAPQVLYGNVGFTIGSGTSPQLGTDDGGNAVGWFPGGSMFFSYSASPDVKLGFAAAGNFGLSEQYHDAWVGRYYVQKATLLGVSFLPSVAYRIIDQLSVGASLNAMLGVLRNRVAVNTSNGPDGQLKLEDTAWGFGANIGFLYEPALGTRIGLTYNSRVHLGFNGAAQFSGLSPALTNLLQARGLLNANVDIRLIVPQGVMLSAFQEINDRIAILGSFGWQQWSRFGDVEIGVDSNDPRSLTTNLNFKDTWHGALGGQLHLGEAFRLDLGVAYDSDFQDSSKISPSLPANASWRFGAGLHHDAGKSFSWGAALEYAYGGTLNIDKQGTAPVALGGRGNLVGSYDNTGLLFLTAQGAWRF